MADRYKELAELVKNALAQLPAGSTQRDVREVCSRVVSEWQAGLFREQIMVERNPDDPNKLDVLIGPDVARALGLKVHHD